MKPDTHIQQIGSLYSFGRLMIMLNCCEVKEDKYGLHFGGSR